MKVAIASNDKITIAEHFGKAKGFVIYRIEDGKINNKQYRINDFTGHARGLEGTNHSLDHHGRIVEALKDCGVVISRGMGRRIYNELQSNGIQALIVDENDTSKAVRMFIEKRLNNHPEKVCKH